MPSQKNVVKDTKRKKQEPKRMGRPPLERPIQHINAKIFEDQVEYLNRQRQGGESLSQVLREKLDELREQEEGPTP